VGGALPGGRRLRRGGARIDRSHGPDALGQPLVINNKPGAATNIGADYVAHAKPDGYTVLTGDTATLAANPALYTKLSYSAEKDLAPIGLLARFPMILVVNPAVPAKNLAEFTGLGQDSRRGASATPRRAPAARTTWRPSCSAARPA
jgi:tripartite-type tricarboxylate transporter receptor subunit TctC